MILVVGNPGDWTALRRIVASGEELRFIGFADLTADLLRALQPPLVVTPLVGQGFDVIEVALRLASAGFQGRFRAVTPPIPNPGVVRAEIQEVAADLDFDLVIVTSRHH